MIAQPSPLRTFLVLVPVLVLLSPPAHTAGVPPVVDRAAVSWEDAAWPAEMGSVPLGNGDVSANVWVAGDSGDLMFYLAKSDAFDINALPIKVGRIRVQFQPPLWQPGAAFNASRPGWHLTLTPADGTVTIADGAGQGYAVTVKVDANAPVLRVAASHSSAPFTMNASLELFDEAANWKRNESRPYTSLATTATWNGTGRNPTAFGSYCLMPFLEHDTVVPAAQLSSAAALFETVVWYHRNEDTQAAHGRPTYYENVMRTQGLDPAAFPDLLLHRTFGGAMGGAGFTRTSDTTLTVASTTAAVLEVLLHTEESPAAAADWIDLLGAAVKAEAARATLAEKDTAHTAAWEGLWGRSYIDVRVSAGGAGLGLASPDDVEAVNDAYVWQRFLDLADGRNTWGVIKFNGQAFTTSLNGTPGGARNGVVSADYRDWGPSNWIQNTRQPYYAAVAAGDSDVLVGILRYFNRSLAVARARVNATFGIGGAYWPETSTLFGTYDAAYLGYGCNGAGTAESPFAKGKSEGRSGAGPTVPAVNGYTRFYTSGSLEVCFLGLEEYLISGDAGVLQGLTLPICDAVTQFYRERFPSLNKTTGKTDLFPGQVIESYWCGNGGAGTNAWGHVNADGKLVRPYSRGECPTNGAPDVAGLRAVLSKLVGLPSAAVPAQYTRSTAAWRRSLGTLPALATEPCHFGGRSGPGPSSRGCRRCIDCPKCNSSTCWCNGHTPCSPPTETSTVVAVAGDYAGIREHNHENHAAYAVWPFRQYAAGKPDLAVGQATYAHRPHPCNHNWCQDVADAAMLNLSTDAANQVVARAVANPMASADAVARFRGFSQHYEDYSPAADHLSMMRIAMHEMLMGRLDDADQTITLFPGWPVASWDVAFKLKGPLNTTVEAACTSGKLTKLVVVPASRRAAVQVHNCKE